MLSGSTPSLADGFSALELPPVETRIGQFIEVEPSGIDRRGRVIGGAWPFDEQSPGSFGEWVGFRFYPKTGITRVIDPTEAFHTDFYKVTNRGLAYGESFPRSPRQQELFLHSDKAGFDFLEKGSTRRIRRNFAPDHLTEKGNLSGTVVGDPFLYLKGRGWIDLWERHEPVAEYLEKVLVNDRGDFALESPIETFVSLNGGNLERIGPEGSYVALEALGKRGQVIGSYRHPPRHIWEGPGPDRPYVFTLNDGFVDILDGGLEQGVARWIGKGGAIYGTATRDRGGDTLFRLDPGGALETVDLRRAFDESIAGYTFRSAKVVDVNKRGQLVAAVTVRPRNITTCWGTRGSELFVYFDQEQGFLNLQEAVDEADLDLLIFEIVDLNDRGHIVARACRAGEPSPGWPWTGVLLRPR